MQQMSIFDDILPRFKITKPIRLITLFSGIGAQEKALEILKVPFEHYKTCEWAFNSYCSYNAIHIKDKTDYAKDLTKDELIAKVKGTSINYNEPLTDQQLAKKSVEWLKTAFNNIVATHNLVNIMNVKGKDLEIVDKDKYNYILTYSFPCQDLSMAGNRKGMSVSQANGGTRSGLLWEVERILTELKSLSNQMPDVLIMENVPEVCGSKNVRDFEKWQTRLQELGYTNYCEILNGKDYGIPQNRKRCFMVSILGEYNYTFPSKIELKYKLQDLLEKQVGENYYLSQKMIDYCLMEKENFNRKNVFLKNLENTEKGISGTLTTKEGNQATNPYILVKNNTKQGYLEAEAGDGVNISSRMHHQRGNVAKQSSMTLTTAGGQQVGVVVSNLKEQLCNKLIEQGMVKDGDIVKHSYTQQIMSGKKKAVEKQGEMITLTTRGDCLGIAQKQEESLRIRKLVPVECMKLMGFERKDEQAMREIGMSDNAIYHCAGDSIIATVLVGIFSNMINEINTHERIIADYVDCLKNE